MEVITVANQKGGIGKTTTAINTANILSSMGYRTLLIDTDAQCNSTDTFKAKSDGVATVYDILIAEEKDRVSVADAIQHTEVGDILASDRLLIEADEKLKSDIDGVYLMQDALKNIENDYDYVIIDTNPQLNHLLYNCLVASNKVIIPILADRYSYTGLHHLSQTIKKIQNRQNKDLKIEGLLLVKYNRNRILDTEMKEEFERAAESIGTKVFDVKIRESTKLREAQASRIPLLKYAPKNKCTNDYIQFVRELIGLEYSTED